MKDKQQKCASHSAHGNNHMLLMMLPCVIIALVVVGYGLINGWGSSQWSVLIMLAVCGFGHLFMMKGHKH